MMNEELFQKNISCLNEEHLKLKEMLLEKEPCFRTDLTVGVEVIEDRKILYVIKEEEQYQMDSLYDSNIVLDRWIGQFSNENFRSRYLLFGIGNGMYVRKLLKRIDSEAVVIIQEPCIDILYMAMREFDFTDILKSHQVRLCVQGIDEVVFRQELDEYLTFEDLVGGICRAYLNYPVLFPSDYKEFDETIKFVSNSLEANESVMVRFGEAYFENTLRNYPYFAKGKSLISLYKKIPKDIPAIIVAAGPSLDKNMHDLNKAKNKSIIIAVDSAVRALLLNNIMPDMMITVDAMKWGKHFEEEGVKKIPMVCNLISNHYALKSHSGNMFFLNDFNPHIQKFHDEIGKTFPYVTSGGSVATDAFALAERLKVKSIILVGQDLAYTNNKTHSSSTARGELNLEINKEKSIEVEGIDGKPISSSYEFMIYKDWFETEIEKNDSIKVIDATEGGAKIKGTEIMTLAEAISRECKTEINIEKVMEEVPSRFTGEEQEAFFKFMSELPQGMKVLRSLVQKNIRIFEKMMVLTRQGKYTNSEMNRLVDKTAEYSHKIEHDPFFYYINNRIFKNDSLKEIYKKQEDEQSEIMYSIDQAMEYYRMIDKAIKETIPYTEDIIAQVEKDR